MSVFISVQVQRFVKVCLSVFCVFCCLMTSSCDSEIDKLSMKQNMVKEEYDKMKKDEEAAKKTPQAETVKEEKSEFEIVDNEDYESFMKVFSKAKNSVIVVDSMMPDWMLSRIDMLIEENPYIRIYLVQSQKKIRHRNVFFVPELRASYVVIDASCVLFNPTYSVADLGLSYYVCNDVIGDKYFQFAQSLARDHTVD